MTREKAIQMLKEKRQTFIDEWADIDDIVEAFDMAITVLSKADNAENPNLEIARSLEEMAKELRRIREVMEGHTRFIKCNKFMTSEEFKKLEADLKRQDPNIILLAPGVELDNGQGRANNV